MAQEVSFFQNCVTVEWMGEHIKHDVSPHFSSTYELFLASYFVGG
jgi:hypothetical protein